MRRTPRVDDQDQEGSSHGENRWCASRAEDGVKFGLGRF